MEEVTEKVIFELDVSEYENKLSGLTKSIDNLKNARIQLREQAKNGDQEAAKLLEATNVQIKIQKNEYRAVQRTLQGYMDTQNKGVSIQKFANNSISENRALLKQLIDKYNNTRNPSKEFTATVKKLTDTIKEQEGAVGNTSRNVGNYAEGFKEAMGGVLSGIPAMQGFKTAQMGVNAAMNANPIGAVIMLFQGLVSIMSENKEIADNVSFVFAGVKKTFGFVIDTIKNTITNFDNLTNAIKHPIDFLLNFGKGAANAAAEGYKAAAAMDELKTAAAKLNVETEIYRETATSLEKSLKDRTQTEQARIKIANQIADIEISLAKKTSEARKKELEALQLQNKGRDLSNEEEIEMIKKQGEVKIALMQAQTAEAQRQMRINILLEKEKTENLRTEKANQTNIIKDNSEEQFENERTIRAAEISLLQDSLEKRLREFDLSFEAEEKKLRKARATEILITELRNKKVAEIEQKWASEHVKIQKDKAQQIDEVNAEMYAKSEQQALDSLHKEEQEIIKIVTAITSQVSNLLGSVSNLINQIANENIDSLNEQAKSGAITQAKFASETREIKEKAWKQSKAIALTQAVMNTANSIMAQISNPTPYVGFVLAALAAAMGGVQIAMIAKQKMPKFARGVIGLQGEGTSTSDSIQARLSKGESVMTAKATSVYHNELARMEMSVGNKPNYTFGRGHFANGFIPVPDSGVTARDVRRDSIVISEMRNAVIDGVKQIPAPELSIVEFNTKNKQRSRSVGMSSL